MSKYIMTEDENGNVDIVSLDNQKDNNIADDIISRRKNDVIRSISDWMQLDESFFDFKN
jgi:hypothetical protein